MSAARLLKEARAAGLSEAVIGSLRAGQEPAGLSEVQQAALQAARCALELKTIPRDLQESLTGHIGLKGVIELVVLVGFYRMIAGLIFTFEVPLPEGAATPF